ncbi:sugar ABC transporter permease [Marispirochaeta sp.]|jgi:multiple sugar transport system permease protein|uniref:carbohydrate ABC transporter permease n=1 Tax=Marispirochaeta sp. TaxID=2038653 RepID=UPI0029C7764A|nr:sugar ABC transporter permease [Marispirochaeta sp.]
MKRAKQLNNETNTAILFLLPSFAGFVLFILLPILSSFLVSFTNYSGSLEKMQFTGLRNYALIFSNAKFWKAITVTLTFVASSVIFQLFLGFCFALILNKKLIGKVIFRSILFLPVVLSSVAVCMAFLFIFHPTAGPANNFLMSLNLKPVPWLADKSTALMTIIIVFVWQSFGYYMIIFLSGLQTINPALYEVADIDGASDFQKLINVTIPGLSPVIFFSLVIALINAFKMFDHVFIMTGGQYGGGPADSTRVLAFDIYQNGFLFWQIGYGAAESVILFLIILAITIIQYRFQRSWVTYDIV